MLQSPGKTLIYTCKQVEELNPNFCDICLLAFCSVVPDETDMYMYTPGDVHKYPGHVYS